MSGHLALVAGGARQALAEEYAGRLFLTVAEVARLSETDPRTVRRAIDLEQIPARHFGTVIRVPAAAFWALCGLDPLTLEPTTAAVDGTDVAATEAS